MHYESLQLEEQFKLYETKHDMYKLRNEHNYTHWVITWQFQLPVHEFPQ